MGDKKRKSLTTGPELPKKKTKISLDDYPNLKEVKAKPDSSSKLEDAKPSTSTTTPSAPPAAGSKKSRKRAADFLSDDDDGAPEVSSSKQPQNNGGTEAGKAAHNKQKRKKQKAKIDANKSAETLTADGVNGVTEKQDSAKVKTNTANKSPAKSMQVEAQRTADHELEDEWGGLGEEEEATKEASGDNEDQEEENGAYLLEGFDSDSSDKEDKDYDGKTPELSKKARKLLKATKDKTLDNGTGVVYLGRIPHGFYENEIRGYLGQYGDITKLRLSRNKRTGASKHFAFVEFASNEVAKIVAEANNNYMMFGHRLKCSVVADPAKLHKDIWKGANKKFRKIPHEKIEGEKLAAPKSVEEWEKKNKREQKKRDKKAEELKEIGYEMPDVKLKDPKEAIEQAKLLEQKSDETVKAIEEGKVEVAAEPAKAIEETKGKATKPATEAKETTAVVNGDVKENAAETVTEANAATNGNVKAAEDSSNLSKEERKALKKAKKAKARAEAVETNGEAARAETETALEPKQIETEPSTDSKLSSKSKKPKKPSESSQKKQDNKDKTEVKGVDVRKEHKKDQEPEAEGKRAKKAKKHHEAKDQELVETSNNDIVAGKKEKKKKKSKSAA